ncbi:MAG: carotenoid 1,2-hydratase, partial [Halobacteria archaeon]|nr:carotenoid 1,2-hydratase [Halobacteria archaeon]
RLIFIVIVILAATMAVATWMSVDMRSDTETEIADMLNVGDALGGHDISGYARADEPRQFSFPDDHGAHPRFRNEWWYFTGNLRTANGRRFGYQFVIFRIALKPESSIHPSHWASNQVYMGHFALTDPHDQRFIFQERFSRPAIGLAGAQSQPFRVWLENWFVAETSGDHWELHATTPRISLQLELQPQKPVVLQGEKGLSRKNSTPGNASYYYSITRLATHGTVTVDEVTHTVDGESWLDREWSTSALGVDQVGWDWFSLQLSNGYDLMYYQLRRKDGAIDPFSSGTLIDPDGQTLQLRGNDITIELLETWQSPRGGRYPSQWRLRIPSRDMDMVIRPVLADQELDVSVRYWEGAVDFTGQQDGVEMTGHGYVELTGYE